jgi:hypothetical protein
MTVTSRSKTHTLIHEAREIADGFGDDGLRGNERAMEVANLLTLLANRLERHEHTMRALRAWVQTPRYRLTADHETRSQWHEGIDSAQGEVYDILEKK